MRRVHQACCATREFTLSLGCGDVTCGPALRFSMTAEHLAGYALPREGWRNKRSATKWTDSLQKLRHLSVQRAFAIRYRKASTCGTRCFRPRFACTPPCDRKWFPAGCAGARVGCHSRAFQLSPRNNSEGAGFTSRVLRGLRLCCHIETIPLNIIFSFY